MNWQNQLITIYLYVCKHYQNYLWILCQRMSNYVDLKFSDEEVITLYLFGVIDKNRELKRIYEYADRHLREGFPQLPSYTAFVQRLNKVADVFAPLLEMIQQDPVSKNKENVWLMDSFPVALARLAPMGVTLLLVRTPITWLLGTKLSVREIRARSNPSKGGDAIFPV